MLVPGNFLDAKLVFESYREAFYRGRTDEGGPPYLLKQIKGAFREQEIIKSFKNEIKLNRELEHEGIIKLLGISYLNSAPALVMEDPGGINLASHLSQGKLATDQFLDLALSLTSILQYIHERSICHYHVKPANIFVDHKRQNVKLTGFYIYDHTPESKQDINKLHLGDAVYISPEQTGRLGQAVDQRTDLYSAGIVFYEMLTGQKPFDLREKGAHFDIFYSHLAEEAIPFEQIDHTIPPVLAEIIFTLIQKASGKRYQSASDLRLDLENCRTNLLGSGASSTIGYFRPIKSGYRQKPLIPEKIVGRETELNMLSEAWNQVREGHFMITLVSGVSGVGKTSLVKQLAATVNQEGGRFLYAKYNQHKKNVPYEAFGQAFEALFQEVLTRDKASIKAWRKEIYASLGDNVALLLKIFPHLEHLVSCHSPLEELPHTEAENRLNNTLVSFFQVLLSMEKPLVLFLDDLQWADSGSIRLLELLLSVSQQLPFFVIGAYRSDEVRENDPLQHFCRQVAEPEKDDRFHMHLEPLELVHVQELVEGIIQTHNEDAELLAKLCYAKTKGNPFLMAQFISALQEEEALYYHPLNTSWVFDAGKVQISDAAENMFVLITRKIASLPPATGELLKIASCMNNIFDTQDLAAVKGLCHEEVEPALKEAMLEGLLIPVENDLSGKEYKTRFVGQYRFIHDQVQQETYRLINEREKKQYHLLIGRYLWEPDPCSSANDNLLAVVDHFNLAGELALDYMQSSGLARLNLEAGKKAKTLSAYKEALDYYAQGLALLEEHSWNDHYKLAFDLHASAVEAAYLADQYELMEELGNVVLAKAKSVLEKAKIFEVKIEYLTATNRPKEAVDLARHVLKMFGYNIPPKPTYFNIVSKYLSIRLTLFGRIYQNIAEMPLMENKNQLAASRILLRTGIAAHAASPRVMVMIILHLVHLSLQYGLAPATPTTFAAYGHILSAYFKRSEEGYRFGKLALDLQSRLPTKAFECKTRMVFEMLVRHHCEHIRETLKNFPATHQSGFSTGDLTSAGYALIQHFAYLYLSGKELYKIKKELEQYISDIMKTGHTVAIVVCHMYLQSIENLLRETPEPWLLNGQHFKEEEMLDPHEDSGDQAILFDVYLNKMILACLFNHYDLAWAYLLKTEEYFEGGMGTYYIPTFYFYGALTSLAMYENAEDQDKVGYKKKALTLIKKLNSFYRSAPENNAHKYYLARAQLSYLRGKHTQAGTFFKQAVKLAGENKFLQEEAYASELAAAYYYATGNKALMLQYARHAIFCYSRWGCLSKVAQLQGKYRELISKDNPDEMPAAPAPSLDLDAIIRASQAISEEIVLSDLLKKVMQVVLQHAGARKAFFALEKERDLFVVAEGNTDIDQGVVLQQGSLKDNQKIPNQLVNYVYNTGESLILSQKEEISRFAGEDFLKDKETKSLLCMPVLSKGKVQGVLYLENDLIDGVFSQQHLTVLQILAAQFAISMENARLYHEMEAMVEQRTAQLKQKYHELEEANLMLEKASQAKTDFLANISHEVRTPLHGIIGMANLLEKGAASNQEEVVSSILHSSHSMLEIINDLLDVSKIEAARIELEAIPLNIDRLVKDAAAPYIMKAEGKGLQVNSTIKNDLPGTLKGDPVRIKQILINLLSNAVKFTENGIIELEVTVITRQNNKAQLKIGVRDTGIGIPEDKLSYIMDDFTQADSSMTRKYGGTGLGLYITNKLVAMMDGTLEVESKVGHGSIFQCHFWLDYEEGCCDASRRKDYYEAGIKPKPPACDFQGLKILVAEDDPISLKYIKSLLEHLCCEVTLVDNGQAALERLKEADYDCILMDKNMPEKDGIETTRQIRASEADKNVRIPIIALTASALEGEKEKLISEGMDYYLTPIFAFTNLINILPQNIF